MEEKYLVMCCVHMLSFGGVGMYICIRACTHMHEMWFALHCVHVCVVSGHGVITALH